MRGFARQEIPRRALEPITGRTTPLEPVLRSRASHRKDWGIAQRDPTPKAGSRYMQEGLAPNTDCGPLAVRDALLRICA